MRSLRFSFFLLISITVAVVSLPAPARAAPPTDATLAQVLFASGKDAMARGDLATACSRFTESLKLDPAIGTLLNLATCEERSGKLVLALDHFTSARTQLAKDDFRVAFATERITSLSQRVARVVVRLAEPTAKSRVVRDGVEVDPATLGTPITVDPGAHVFVLETNEKPPQRTEITLREGEEKVVELGAKPASSSSAPSTREGKSGPDRDSKSSEDGGTKRTLAFVTAGAGVAGLAIGTVTGLMTIRAASTYRAHCNDGECDPEGLSAASTGRTTRIVSPIAFAVGGVFGIASVYLFVTAPKKSAGTASVRFAPTASREGGGVSISGAF